MERDFFNYPSTYESYVQKIMNIKKVFPFIRIFSIGKTVLGRYIFALGIGNIN